jgi:NAD(P)-dependent dehydrogenase (short-subunit alcohol dehydrogenase family)
VGTCKIALTRSDTRHVIAAFRKGLHHHRIDVLFNNAAMAYFNWIEDITDEEWARDRREEVDLVFLGQSGTFALGRKTIEQHIDLAHPQS